MRVKRIFPRGTAFKLKLVCISLAILNRLNFINEDKRFLMGEKAIRMAL